jgi:hypothetical protein
VTDELKRLIEEKMQIDLVIGIGPVVMMRAVSEVTRPYNIKTVVSLNTIMVDGTGMCGCCRATIGGETKFVCVDGPEFDGHQVDFKSWYSGNRCITARSGAPCGTTSADWRQRRKRLRKAEEAREDA